MNRVRFVLRPLIALAWLGTFAPGQALAQPVPLGPEIRVDTIGPRQPAEPLLAVGPGGDFEIAWGYVTDTIRPFVSARHFDADGNPTDPAQVEIGLQGPYANVKSVTATPRGFEVLWQLGDWPKQPSLLRRLDSHGAPVGPPLLLNRGLSARWVWNVEGQGILGGWPMVVNHEYIGLAVQHINAAGKLTGPVLRLNSRPVADDERPLLTALPGGGFVAVWLGVVSRSPGDFVMVLRARVFSPAGKPLGPDFDVNSVAADLQDNIYYPKVAAAPGGGFAVAWRFFDDDAKTTTSYVRFFDAAGRPLGPEIPGLPNQGVESMAFDDAGNLLVLWADDPPTPEIDFKVQLLDGDGTPLGPQTSVISAASGRFKLPARGNVAWGKDAWIVTWWANAVSPTGRPSAIFMRRFSGD
jgi:hypothetical protein